MRLFYLYVRTSSVTMEHACTDGHFDLFRWMLQNKVVDEVHAVIDNYLLRGGSITKTDGLTLERSNGIDHLEPTAGDIIWIRGGWKPWLPWVECMKARGHWLMFYDACTGRKSWPFWDLILSDLIKESSFDRYDRLWLPFPKPVASIFRPIITDFIYDVCIGSSHVYDRKGQWRGYEILLEYQKIFGKKLKAVIPGGYYQKEVHTEAMRHEIHLHPEFVVPGSVPRPQLVEILNASRLYLATTQGGQGDRGPVEAGRCGCPLVMLRTLRAAPYTYENPRVTWVAEDQDDYEAVARGIHVALEDAEDRRELVANHFSDSIDVEKASGPLMVRVFEFFKRHPKADREKLKELA